MATVDNSHFSWQNNFSQDFPITSPNTNTNLCSFPPQIFDSSHVFSDSLQQHSFVQGIEMGFDRGHEMISFSYPCSSSSSATFTNDTENSLMNSLVFSQPFSSLLDKHCYEVDLYLHFQGEKLKEALQQQKNQQMALILNRYQSRTMTLLREKEEILEKLRDKSKMLVEYLKKKEEEIQVWQRVAKEKEDMIIELNNMLLLIKQNLCNFVCEKGVGENNKNDCVESVCDCESLNNARGKKGGKTDDYEERKRDCKWCNSKEMCVVFLPCRHLCCCKECELLLEFCPVCQSVKQGSMEILLS